jgi:hypothetical protein
MFRNHSDLAAWKIEYHTDDFESVSKVPPSLQDSLAIAFVPDLWSCCNRKTGSVIALIHSLCNKRVMGQADFTLFIMSTNFGPNHTICNRKETILYVLSIKELGPKLHVFILLGQVEYIAVVIIRFLHSDECRKQSEHPDLV